MRGFIDPASCPYARRGHRVSRSCGLFFHAVLFAIFINAYSVSAASAKMPPPRERLSFNSDWRFIKGDPIEAANRLNRTNLQSWLNATGLEFTTHSSTAAVVGNPGGDISYTQPEFDDSSWRKLNLPHDWGIEGSFQQDLPGETAKLPYSGVGWYRKHFDVPAMDRGKKIFLDLDGAMSYATVWLNGQFVGGWPCGYTSFQLDFTPFVKFGGKNVVAIRLDNPPDSSRWYPGGGIYRNLWLLKTSGVHVKRFANFVTTPIINPESATLDLQIDVANDTATAVNAAVKTIVYELKADGDKGRAVGRAEILTGNLEPKTSQPVKMSLKISKPQLWSPTKPNLYVAVVELERDTAGGPIPNEQLDHHETIFGIRTIEFTVDNGFLLNGERVPIKGVCLHHDFGALGAAFNLRAQERQLEFLKELGCNAVRTSHNPPAPELLDLCDRMGFLVMNEAFDAWRMAKRPNDYHVLFDDWHEKDLRAFIRRDRNHPSVILWSLGNEVYEQRDGTNAPLAVRLARIAHEEDPTRPVNMALHVVAASTNGFQDAVDVFGYNYTPFGYAAFRTHNPTIPLLGSETSSCVSSRGEYFFPVSDNRREGRVNFQATSYDYAAPSWAMAPDIEFKAQDENPFVAGEFVWTGFDYLGEPTPYDTDTTNRLKFTDASLQTQADRDLAELGKIRVPSRSSYFGIFDLCGFRKDRFYLYQARWRPDFPMAHILPHWNWPERAGEITPIHVYTSGDEAELFLNGKSLGRKQKGRYEYRLRWDDVVYQPGELRVAAYKHGKKWATDSMLTTGSASQIVMQPDRIKIRSDGQDLSFVTVSITDGKGRAVPRAKNRIRFSIEGPGEIVATDNGDATSHESFQQPDRNAFNGLCLVIIRAQAGHPGKITLTAESEGMKTTSAMIRCIQ
jgi:beta-galactosidase